MTLFQGERVRVVDRARRCLGPTLALALAPHLREMATFADVGRPRLSNSLTELWSRAFPMVLPPEPEDGLGIILFDSNADTHFSFTNALGMIPIEQARALDIACRQYPRAFWLLGLHHHLVEYPTPAKALSERIGTALVNGNWFVRRLRPLADRVVLLHGHRHVDWIGECAGLQIVSAPSPVMEATDDVSTCFYIHTLAVGPDRRLKLLAPERITVEGEPPPQHEGAVSIRDCRATARLRRSSVFEQSLLERRRGLEEEHQHRAAVGRRRRMAAALGADDEIAGGAFAFVIDQRAFEHEGLLQILVHVRRECRRRARASTEWSACRSPDRDRSPSSCCPARSRSRAPTRSR